MVFVTVVDLERPGDFEDVTLRELVLDTVTDPVLVTETVDVRDEVVVLETVGELLIEPVKEADTEDDTLELPDRDAVELTEGVIVGTIVRVKEGSAEVEPLTEVEGLMVNHDTVGLTVIDTLPVRVTVSVRVCVQVRTRVAVEVAVIAVEPEAVLLFVRLTIALDDTVTDDDAVLVDFGLAESVTVRTLVEETKGDLLLEIVCRGVLETRGEYDCVLEPVVVFDTEAELLIVREGTRVTDARGLTVQHADIDAVFDTVAEPHPDRLNVARLDEVA
jgi:hypothetical protein